MRNKKEYRRISITKQNYERLEKDKKNFENDIGGGKWSMNDTITEYLKILDAK